MRSPACCAPFPGTRGADRSYLPQDLLLRHGVARDDIVTRPRRPRLLAALADLRAVARRHLSLAKILSAAVPAEGSPAFRPLALVEPYLREMERAGYDPFRTAVELPQWRRVWALWRGKF